MSLEEQKKELVKIFLEKKILVDPELILKIDNEKKAQDLIKMIKNDSLDSITFTRDFIEKANSNKNQEATKKPLLIEPNKNKNKVEIVFSYKESSKKREIQDFVKFFNKRYNAIKRILMQREELQNSISINKLKSKAEREKVTVIGIILEKQETKNKNIILTIEDPTGTIKVLANKTKPELLNIAKDCVLDEVIAVAGVNSSNIIFANNIYYPDIPMTNEFKKLNREEYAIVLADLHVGSNDFLPNKFEKFLKWINCEVGSESQKQIAKKISYVFIVGDLVDGVGIYPGQEKDLNIPDVYEQYIECARLLSRIPKHIKLIICPGNHDALRIAEPQPCLINEFAEPIKNLPNATLITNPGIVKIAENESFPGFLFLLYHGYSYDYYGDNVESIRMSRPNLSERADLIMKFLLQRRHLAPTHTSTLYIPEIENDPLVIDRIPDFFISGHIHKAAISSYRNITLISSSCWQKKTEFQEKVGHEPDPGRVPIINLQTRQIKMLNF